MQRTQFKCPLGLTKDGRCLKWNCPYGYYKNGKCILLEKKNDEDCVDCPEVRI